MRCVKLLLYKQLGNELIKVLTVLDSYPPDLNGGAYFTHRLAQGLQAKGHQVLVICPSRTLAQGYTTYDGVQLYAVRSWPIGIYKNMRVAWPLFITKGIVAAIQTFNPDVVHIQGRFFLGSICYRTCKKLEIPMVATNHFMPENFFHYTRLPNRCKNWFKRVCWQSILEMLSSVNRVTTPTQTAAKLLKDIGLDKTVHVISCGINLTKFKPNQNAELLRQRFQIPNKPTLLYTGRLDKEKNLPTVLHAFHTLRNTVDAHFVLTGRGAELPLLKSLINQLNLKQHVTFTGYLSDEEYPLIYGLAHCFVNASSAELQSIVALEALASGLPLLAANAMALPELVLPGINGYLFEPNDSDTLAQHLISVLNNPSRAKAMGQESFTIARKHDILKTIDTYEALYQEIITYENSDNTLQHTL